MVAILDLYLGILIAALLEHSALALNPPENEELATRTKNQRLSGSLSRVLLPRVNRRLPSRLVRRLTSYDVSQATHSLDRRRHHGCARDFNGSSPATTR